MLVIHTFFTFIFIKNGNIRAVTVIQIAEIFLFNIFLAVFNFSNSKIIMQRQ